jgi:hypothetical protein
MVSAILFLPSESRTNRSSPDHLKAGLTSLDRFGMNKIFFMTLFFIKGSRLATIRNPEFWVRLSNARDRHKIESESRTVSGFRMHTVLG